MSVQSFLLIVAILSGSVLTISSEIRHLGNSVVHLKSGDIRGLWVTFKDSRWTPVELYRGLSYGSLGKQDQATTESNFYSQWNKTLIVDQWAKVCPQEDIGGVKSLKDMLKVLPRVHVIRLYHRSNYTKNQMEDCLTLNVFLPARGKLFISG